MFTKKLSTVTKSLALTALLAALTFPAFSQNIFRTDQQVECHTHCDQLQNGAINGIAAGQHENSSRIDSFRADVDRNSHDLDTLTVGFFDHDLKISALEEKNCCDKLEGELLKCSEWKQWEPNINLVGPGTLDSVTIFGTGTKYRICETSLDTTIELHFSIRFNFTNVQQFILLELPENFRGASLVHNFAYAHDLVGLPLNVTPAFCRLTDCKDGAFLNCPYIEIWRQDLLQWGTLTEFDISGSITGKVFI